MSKKPLAVPVAFGVLLFASLPIGCDTDPPPPPLAANDVAHEVAAVQPTVQPTSKASADQKSDPKSASAPGVEAAGETTEVQAEVSREPVSTAVAAPPAKKDQAAAAAPPAPPVPQPTPDQLAKWQLKAYPQVQLLSCRQWNQIGLVHRLVPLADGQHFITAGSKVALWDLREEKPSHLFWQADGQTPDHFVRSLAMAPDGSWFATGDSEGTLRLWNTVERTERISKPIYSNDIVDIAIAPDATELATISFDGVISLWRADTLEPVRQIKANRQGLLLIRYVAPGLLAAFGETMVVWNLKTDQAAEPPPSGRYHKAFALAPDGQEFLVGDDQQLHRWDIAQAKVRDTLPGSFASDELIAYSPDAKKLVTANGSTVRWWDLERKKLTHVFDTIGTAIVGLAWLPKSNVIVIASENGRIRLWGDDAAGKALGLAPLHQRLEIDAATAEVPASTTALVQLLDLRTLPMLPACVPMIANATTFSGSIPVKLDEAKLFYRFVLGRLGWTELPTPSANPASLEFSKHGFLLSTSFYEEGEGKTQVHLNYAGNQDLQQLPKFDGATIEKVYDSPHSVIYKTQANLTEIEANLLRQMHAAGWVPYSRLHSSKSEQIDQRDLTFFKNCTTIQVTIGRFPADPSSYHVSYSRFLTIHSLPVPPDASFVEFDGSTQPQLVAVTKMDLKATADFYERVLGQQGWISWPVGKTLKEEYAWLPFVHEQQDLVIGLVKLESGQTLVRVGENLDQGSWQLAKPKTEEKSGDQQAGLEAADFPILTPTQTAKFDAADHSIEIQLDETKLADAAARYTQALESKGWKGEEGGIRSEDYTMLTFKQEKAEITLRMRSQNGKAIVNVQGDGLRWSKPLPVAKTAISYEAWLREHRLPATLDLLDRFQEEMQALAGDSGSSR